MGGVIDFLEEAEDELVLGIESESACSEEDLSDISASLARVGIEGEEGMEFGNAFRSEDGVLGSNILSQDCLELFLLNFTLRHGS